MQLETALQQYTDTILGSITAMAPVAVIGLIVILLVLGAARR
jgi:hypothetical protein